MKEVNIIIISTYIHHHVYRDFLKALRYLEKSLIINYYASECERNLCMCMKNVLQSCIQFDITQYVVDLWLGIILQDYLIIIYSIYIAL